MTKALPRRLASKRAIGAIIGVLLGIIIGWMPPFGGLEPLGQAALGISLLAVVFWATDVLNVAATAIFVLGLLIAAGVPGQVALSGYASSAFWTLVCVLFFGRAMDKTGLARRLSYQILLLSRSTYRGMLFAFMAIGFVLALGIPSMTVRTAIMVPISWALVQALGLPQPGRGSALIVISAFEMAVLPGCALLTGALWGPYIAGMFKTAGLPITWFGYARIMAVPTLFWCCLLLVCNMLALRPETAITLDKNVIRAEIRKLGPVGASEAVTGIVVVLSIVAWMLQPWHHLPTETVGMFALVALFAARVISTEETGTGIPWNLVLFIGGMISLSTVITTYKINNWLGSFVLPALQTFADNSFVFVAVLALGVMAMRFLDPTGFITIAAFFLSLVTFASSRGIPPLVLVGTILLPVHVFWFNYQNFWVVMTEGISKRMAYTDRHRFRLATVFAAVTLVSLWFGVLYWHLIGAL